MANVQYRRGKKDVHAAPVIGGVRRVPDGCNLDLIPGDEWGPVPPPGSRCAVCFAGVSTKRHPSGERPASAIAAAAATALLASVVLASSLDTPVNVFAFPTPTFGSSSASPGPSPVPPATAVPELPSSTPLVLPGPSGSATPAPVPTLQSAPTFPPLPTWPPLPTFGPLPTINLSDIPQPTPIVIVLPGPTLVPIACTHPGENRGVPDCRWPHN